MDLRLAHWGVTTGVNGPGRRFTVWVQGCPRRCPGCFNPGLLAAAGGRSVPLDTLVMAWGTAAPVDGVALSGGEPFDQGAGLAAFLDAVSGPAGRPGVVAFTGYTLEQLRCGPAAQRRLLERVDLLMDGPFLADRTAGAPALTGSSNQRRWALTPVGAELLRRVDAAPGGNVEVQITAAGEVVVSGFPPPELLAALQGGEER